MSRYLVDARSEHATVEELDFRILGPLEVRRRGEPLPLGAPLQRALLAALLLEPGRTVPVATLMDRMWGDEPPDTATKSIQKYVSNLRRAFGPDRIDLDGGGYRLLAAAEELDAARFEKAVATSDGAEPDVALAAIDDALAMWRGEPLADVNTIFAIAERTRLDELRIRAFELRLRLLVELGRPADAVAEAERLVAEHPLRERLWAHLMTALYRMGRHGEALRAYQRLRHELGEQLGIEPSAELVELEGQILLQDPSLLGASPPSPGNLPAEMTSFIGRAAELADLDQLLDRARLVTLTGVGGSGKTRLALEVARAVTTRDGTWLLELARIADPERLPLALGKVFGLPEQLERPTADILTEYVARRDMLLVVDNCEHVIEAAASLVGSLLRAAPALRIVATSREPLGVAGEAVFAVDPLGLPETSDVDDVEHSEAVCLFVTRASAASRDFALDPDNASAVATVCRRLDGMPLAIELAAARVRSLSPAELAARMDDRFALLKSGRRDVEPRQATLEATIDWSYQLLTPVEQQLLRRLAVFRGTFTLESVEQVCGYDLIGDAQMSQLLVGLVDKSLVIAEMQSNSTTRYRVLETIRDFGMARLDADELSLPTRHAAYYAALVGEPDDPRQGIRHEEQIPLLLPEYDNLRAALEFLTTEGDSVLALRMASSMEHFWDAVGYRVEAHEWMDRVLEVTPDAPPELRARGLLAVSYLYQSADLGRSLAAAEVALAIGRELGDERLIAFAKRNIGWTYAIQSDPRAIAPIEEALEVFRRIGDEAAIAESMEALGTAQLQSPDHGLATYRESLERYLALGDRRNAANVLYAMAARLIRVTDRLDEARGYLEESLRISSELGSRHDGAHALSELGQVARLAGEYEEAGRIIASALAEFRDIGDRRCLSRMSTALGYVRERTGDLDAAGRLVADGIEASLPVTARPNLIRSIEVTGLLATRRREGATAARFFGAAAALHDLWGIPHVPLEAPIIAEAEDEMHLLLGPDDYERAAAAGGSLSLEDAAADAERWLRNTIGTLR